MQTLIDNPWITLSEQRDGVDIQRAYAGMFPQVSPPNEDGKSIVESCLIYYHERELYPSGQENKYEKKSYSLEDLAQCNIGDDSQMLEKLVLTSFVNSVGYSVLVNPVRLTLADLSVLGLSYVSGSPLHKETRPIVDKNI